MLLTLPGKGLVFGIESRLPAEVASVDVFDDLPAVLVHHAAGSLASHLWTNLHCKTMQFQHTIVRCIFITALQCVAVK